MFCAGCSHSGAEGFFCSLDILYGGIGIVKMQFLIQKYLIFSPNYLSSKSWIRNDSLPKMLDPDQDLKSMNPDPKHCSSCVMGSPVGSL
jgi:hypothetical protein